MSKNETKKQSESMTKHWPTRYEKAKVDLKVLASLKYILSTEDDPELYLVMETIKVWGYISSYITMSRIAEILDMCYKDVQAYVKELKHRGWVAEDKGYLKVLKSGDAKMNGVRTKIANIVNEIKNRNETR